MVSSVMFVGDVEPQASAVYDALMAMPETLFGPLYRPAASIVDEWASLVQPHLIVVAGYRRLIPPDVLAIPRLGTVGFHSAKLPEYPGRAPVPWTLLRGDEFAYNTMLYLDEGVDSGDIIDERRMRLVATDTPETIYKWMAHSAVSMLRKHLPALLAGTAPRTPQDMALRGPVTRADGWQRWAERCASSV